MSIYGQHLTMRIRCLDSSPALHQSQDIERFLRSLVERIGMRILAGPLVSTEWNGTSPAGCSGVVILSESHAAIHTYVLDSQLFLDLFSCRRFSIATVCESVSETFGRHVVLEESLADRGLHWDCDVPNALASWQAAR